MTDDRDDGPPEPAPATIDSDDGTAQPTDMVRLIINDAPPVAASAPTEVDDGRGRAGGTEIEPFGGLPRDCPVVPLGRNGDEFFYLDSTGQVQSGRGKEHSGLFIINLYAPHSNLLDEHFPRLGAKNTPIGWDQRRAAMLLMDSCARHGLFEPASHLRERGAWLGEDGELVWHVGDRVLVGDRSHRPGPIGEHVYPARPKGPLPTDDVEIARTAGTRLLDLFMSWAWRDPEIAARLMLGWVSAAMVGGALPWRPMVWVAGAHGTGKSTLHNAIGHVFNGDIIQSSDASAAGIWQRLRHSSLPIAIEEIEAGGHSHTVEGVIRLARQAASGGLVLRGGADHTASQFTVLSAFMFSSILIPPLLPQDRSRIAVLELGELPADAPAPEIRPNELAEIGAGLRRRLIDGWKRREDFAEGWRSALKSAGHSARTSDQYGTLLALADLEQDTN